jgi:phage FluMu gp28-like protein
MLGGSISYMSTHFGEDTYFAKRIQRVEAGLLDDSLHSTNLLEACEQGFFQRVCWMRGELWTPEKERAYIENLLKRDSAAEEFMCIPAKSGAGYFSRSTVEACMDEGTVVRLKLEDSFTDKNEAERCAWIEQWFKNELAPRLRPNFNGWDTYVGQDFARSPKGDLSVITFMRIEENLVRAVPVILEMRGVPYKQQEQIALLAVSLLPRLRRYAIDAGGNGGFLAEALGSTLGKSMVVATHINDAVYRELLPKLKAATETQNISLPPSAELLGDFMRIIRKEGCPVLPRSKEADGDGYRHGDTVIALMLAYEQSLHGGNVSFRRVKGYKAGLTRRREDAML